MSICKNCGCEFKKRFKLDGKIVNCQNRKFCFICSPYKSRGLGWSLNYKIDNNIPLDSDSTCSVCSRKFKYSKKAGHQLTKCNSCVVHLNRKHVKSKCIEYLGGKCSKCGYNKCHSSLAFHHKDPKTKLFAIGDGSSTRNWCKIQNELDKCILLCHNCHSELHHASFA